MSTADEETIAALQTLVANIEELGHINIRDLLTPGKNAQYKATLDTAYDALVKVEDALDSLELKLEYHHWRISSAFEPDRERVEIGKQANNAYWIEVNQKNLDERVRPAIALLKQGQTVAKNDKYEREYTQEEWEQWQAQQHAQEETHE